MKCPECGNEMEQESCPYVANIQASKEGDSLIAHKVSATHYYCQECDAEWIKTTGKMRKLDGAEPSLATLLAPSRDDILQDRALF